MIAAPVIFAPSNKLVSSFTSLKVLNTPPRSHRADCRGVTEQGTSPSQDLRDGLVPCSRIHHPSVSNGPLYLPLAENPERNTRGCVLQPMDPAGQILSGTVPGGSHCVGIDRRRGRNQETPNRPGKSSPIDANTLQRMATATLIQTCRMPTDMHYNTCMEENNEHKEK